MRSMIRLVEIAARSCAADMDTGLFALPYVGYVSPEIHLHQEQ